LALLSVLLFFPIGFAAVAKSRQVPRLWAQGKHTEALQAAGAAKARAIWAIVALVILAAVVVAAFVLHGRM
jgi:hypothetical protein